MLSMKIVKRVSLKSSHHKKKKIILFVSVWESECSLYCGNHFML